jgi:large subunit ribosomal protein L13
MQKATPYSKLSDFKREWYVVDAEGQVLGRLATQIANVLRGKNKPTFNAHIDCGDNVIIINTDKIVLTGKKMDQKLYRRHSGYLGNLKTQTAKEVMEKHPTRIVEKAISGMLPKNKLRKHYLSKLHLYAGPEHKHAGQAPKELKFN